MYHLQSSTALLIIRVRVAFRVVAVHIRVFKVDQIVDRIPDPELLDSTLITMVQEGGVDRVNNHCDRRFFPELLRLCVSIAMDESIVCVSILTSKTMAGGEKERKDRASCKVASPVNLVYFCITSGEHRNSQLFYAMAQFFCLSSRSLTEPQK